MADDHDESSQASQNRFFDEWISIQTDDLSELLESLSLSDDDPSKKDKLSGLIEKSIQHFEEYINKRTQLGRDRVAAFYAPPWCTSLENSLLWIGGCRPSMFIRLVYALCGSEFEPHLSKFLLGSHIGTFSVGGAENVVELSGRQLNELDNVQRKTIKEEERVTNHWASIQEEIADQPLAVLAKKAIKIDELNEETGKALDAHEKYMAELLEEADQLRINSLKEVIKILTPKQAIDILATGKKLHLCVHAWGKKRDAMRSNQGKQE